MKILIFYASYGGGHFNAAKSIYECLKNDYKDKNMDVELIDCMKYVNKTIEKMTTKAYNEMAKKACLGLGVEFTLIPKKDHLLTLLVDLINLWQSNY